MLSDDEWKTVLVALREPKLLSELPIPGPLEFGAPNPHKIEYVRRRIAELIENGEAEHVVEEFSNITGSCKKSAFGGRYRLTAKGISVLKLLNEEAARR
jgi:hypothetical protein